MQREHARRNPEIRREERDRETQRRQLSRRGMKYVFSAEDYGLNTKLNFETIAQDHPNAASAFSLIQKLTSENGNYIFCASCKNAFVKMLKRTIQKYV